MVTPPFSLILRHRNQPHANLALWIDGSISANVFERAKASSGALQKRISFLMPETALQSLRSEHLNQRLIQATLGLLSKSIAAANKSSEWPPHQLVRPRHWRQARLRGPHGGGVKGNRVRHMAYADDSRVVPASPGKLG